MKSLFVRPAYAAGFFLLVLTGCAGYRLGNISGKEIQGVRSIYVPVVKNQSYEPGFQVTLTNAIIRRFDNDGTLETVQTSAADAELDVTLIQVDKKPIRSLRADGTYTSQMEIMIEAEATLVNRRLGKVIFDKHKVTGKTTYWIQEDQTESERQAMPLAGEDLANNVVALVTEGW